MEAMLEPVDEPLIRALDLDAPCRIAEIGCGGGGTALALARRAPKGSLVHGFDLSSSLVALARGRTVPADSSLAFDVADMAVATASDGPYDRLVSRFGVMFFEDPPAAFANLVGWLSPGGRFAFAVWGAAAENSWMTTTRQVVAAVVDLPSPAPDSPGPFRYAESAPLLHLLEGAGFDDVEARVWRGALSIGGQLPAAEAARFALASFSSFGEVLDRAGPATIDRAHRMLTARFSGHERGGAVSMDACVQLITGVRP